VDNIRIDGNTISSTDTDGDITLTPNGDGNVGIGTSPDVLLHIETDTSRTSGVILLENTFENSYPSIRMKNDEYEWHIIAPHGYSNNKFSIYDAGHEIPAHRLVIDKNGNVGIGNVSPSSLLYLEEDLSALATSAFAEAESHQMVIQGGTTDGDTASIAFGTSDDDNIGAGIKGVRNTTGTRTSLQLAAGGATRIHIDGTTYCVGIGTTEPDAKFHLSASGTGSSVPHARFECTSANDLNVRFKANTKEVTFKLDDETGHLHIQNNTYTRLTIQDDGNVGIGPFSAATTTTLQVTGSFTTGLVTIAATDAITAAEHAGRTNLLGEVGGNELVTLTLPDATGTGNVYKFIVSVVNTSSYKFLVPDASNTIDGQIMIMDADLIIPNVYHTAADTDTIILNGTTTGGGSIGDYIELTDIATDQWAVSGMVTCPAGNDDATMFSATV